MKPNCLSKLCLFLGSALITIKSSNADVWSQVGQNVTKAAAKVKTSAQKTATGAQKTATAVQKKPIATMGAEALGTGGAALETAGAAANVAGTAIVSTAVAISQTPGEIHFKSLNGNFQQALIALNKDTTFKNLVDFNQRAYLAELCYRWHITLDSIMKRMIDEAMNKKDEYLDQKAVLIGIYFNYDARDLIEKNANTLRTTSFSVYDTTPKNIYAGAVIARALMLLPDTSDALNAKTFDDLQKKVTRVVSFFKKAKNDFMLNNVTVSTEIVKAWLDLDYSTQKNIIDAEKDFDYLKTDPNDTTKRAFIVTVSNEWAAIGTANQDLMSSNKTAYLNTESKVGRQMLLDSVDCNYIIP